MREKYRCIGREERWVGERERGRECLDMNEQGNEQGY